MTEKDKGAARVATLDEIETQLGAFVTAHYGADAEARAVGPMPGHAGLTFGFEVWQGGRRRDSLVLRIPPKNVRRSGNTDVYRQAPLLRALKAQGLPVPGVPWAEAGDDTEFGVPYIMMERLEGETCFLWDPQPVWPRTGDTVPNLWRQGACALAQIHEFDWRRHLPDWETPRPATEEIARWTPIFGQSPEPEWIAIAEEVRDLLLETMPEDMPVGLRHGDSQIGNILFQDGKVAGVIDWELSGIGAHLLDLGWYMTFADPESWSTKWGPVNPAPIAELQAAYEDVRGRPQPDVEWYRAFAGFRFGSITCLNVKLHRKGYRHDPVWEDIGLSAMSLFGRARELLRERRATGGK
jgi:aminoglycoside phosphotransferase (APT) family kinase protein